jgi:hypothetical protein
MQVGEGHFKFDVPEGHTEAGEEKKGSFAFQQCDDEKEAVQALKDREWGLVKLVNDKLRQTARSNAYQNALAPYRPSEVSQDDIRARMIRDYIRMEIPEKVAREQIDALLAARKAVPAA